MGRSVRWPEYGDDYFQSSLDGEATPPRVSLVAINNAASGPPAGMRAGDDGYVRPTLFSLLLATLFLRGV